jgi:hypothetical protein
VNVGATVTELPDRPAGSIEILNRTGSRLEFSAATSFAPGSLIRVESGDLLWFAEVLASSPATVGFHVLANVEQGLNRAAMRRF